MPAETARTQLSYVAESTFGTTPSSALQTLRWTGETLKGATSVQNSNEVRSDRQVADVKRTATSASGNLDFELSYGTYDDMLLAALCASAWSSPVTVTATTISASASDNSFNDSGNGLGSLVANQWVKVSGFATAGNNGFFKIVSVAAGKIVVKGGTLVDETAGDSVSIVMGAQAVNGTTGTSFSIERKYSDLSSVFAAYRGMMIDQMSLAVNADALVTGTFQFMGKEETSETSTIGTSYTSANANSVFSTSEDVQAILENYTDLDITTWTLQLQNNLRERKVVSTLGPNSLGKGEIAITGTLQVYFADATLANKYLNFTSSALTLTFVDVDGNAYLVDLPRVKYSDGPRNAAGKNADVMLALNYSAFRDPTEDVTIRITKFPTA